MQIERISFSVGYTVNLGNYESARFDVTVEGRVQEGDDLEEVTTDLQHEAKTQLIEAMEPALSKEALARVEARLGLMHNHADEEDDNAH